MDIIKINNVQKIYMASRRIKSAVVKILRIPRGDRRYFNYRRPSSKTKDLTRKKETNVGRKKTIVLSMIESRSCKCAQVYYVP